MPTAEFFAAALVSADARAAGNPIAGKDPEFPMGRANQVARVCREAAPWKRFRDWRLISD